MKIGARHYRLTNEVLHLRFVVSETYDYLMSIQICLSQMMKN